MHVPHRLFLGLPPNGFGCMTALSVSVGRRTVRRTGVGRETDLEFGRNSDCTIEGLGRAGWASSSFRKVAPARSTPRPLRPLVVRPRSCCQWPSLQVHVSVPLFIACFPSPPLFYFPAPLFPPSVVVLLFQSPSPPFLITMHSFPISFYHSALSNLLLTDSLTASLIVTSCPFPWECNDPQRAMDRALTSSQSPVPQSTAHRPHPLPLRRAALPRGSPQTAASPWGTARDVTKGVYAATLSSSRRVLNFGRQPPGYSVVG